VAKTDDETKRKVDSIWQNISRFLS
jgi:4-hydroxy-3-polyprenylbenzoate decarboxylase